MKKTTMRISDLKNLYATLPQPGHRYRSLPFWAWNDRLNPDELRRQMQDMKDKGIGGAFAHSRDGLETPYLSDEWMRDIAVMAEAGAQLGLEAWIYDEDKWPSGSAGGKVSEMNPEQFTARALTLEIAAADAQIDGADVVLCCRAKVDGARILEMGAGDVQIVLRTEKSASSDWYNGLAPSDNLNPDAVRAFIDLTHERYRALFGGNLSDSVEGFFTDEPNFCDFFSAFTPGRPWLPWTQDLPEAFARLRGYDPVPKLPLLFFEGSGSEKIRHDYWRTLTELFSERYMKQIYDWCEDNGVRTTGHVLYENDMGYSVRVCGAAMPHYRYLHMPGVDILGDQTREWLTVRQCSSVAHQYGRDETIAEVYGCTGWEFDFEGQKRLGDWLLVNGINRRCQHMMQYSIAGCRKRDYPPVFNYQNSWWEYDGLMEDYFARMAACAVTGEAARDLLVIHPISSLWCTTGSHPDEDLGRVEMNMGWTDAHIMAGNIEGDQCNRLAEALLRAHRDFDFGDETILAERGAVDGDTLTVGAGRYRAVVVPQVRSLFASTVELLNRYLDAGGRVIWLGDAPELVEGAPDGRIAALYQRAEVRHAEGETELLRALNHLLPNDLRVERRTGGEDDQILTMLRRCGEDCLLIAVNGDRVNRREVRITLPVKGRIYAYDAWTDERRALPCRTDASGTTFVDALESAGSRVYFVEHDEAHHSDELRFSYEHPHRTERVFAALGPVAEFARTAPNALPLDVCRCALGGEVIAENMEVWQAQRILREKLGMRQIYANGIPQRYTWEQNDTAASFEMCFDFEVADVPEGRVQLAVEKSAGLRVQINGCDCAPTGGWFLDRSVDCFVLEGLKPGVNTVSVSGLYTDLRELEEVYVIGDFAVDNARRIARETEKLHFGDWCFQGYPHYSGGMTYRFRLPDPPAGRRIVLKMGRYEGVLAEVLVNGARADVLFGACRRESDLTPLLKARDNLLEIRVIGSPRNLLGPFHRAYDGCSRISWEDFRTEGRWHCDGYTLKPYGLMGQITLLEEDM